MNRIIEALVPIAIAAVLALVAAALVLAPAQAGDEALYGPTAPPNSAFIRVYNATEEQIPLATIASEKMTDVSPYEASEFEFLMPGSYTLTVGSLRQAVNLAPNRYYTAVLVPGNKLQLLDNARYTNRLKALVTVYNLIDGVDLSLKTADGRTAVVEKIGNNAHGSREVNPVRTNFALFRGDTRVASVRPVTLERGKAFDLFVTGSAEQPQAVWVVN